MIQLYGQPPLRAHIFYFISVPLVAVMSLSGFLGGPTNHFHTAQKYLPNSLSPHQMIAITLEVLENGLKGCLLRCVIIRLASEVLLEISKLCPLGDHTKIPDYCARFC